MGSPKVGEFWELFLKDWGKVTEENKVPTAPTATYSSYSNLQLLQLLCGVPCLCTLWKSLDSRLPACFSDRNQEQ